MYSYLKVQYSFYCCNWLVLKKGYWDHTASRLPVTEFIPTDVKSMIIFTTSSNVAKNFVPDFETEKPLIILKYNKNNTASAQGLLFLIQSLSKFQGPRRSITNYKYKLKAEIIL